MTSVAFVPSSIPQPTRKTLSLFLFFFLTATVYDPAMSQLSKLHHPQSISFYLSGGIVMPEPDDNNYGMGYAPLIGLHVEKSIGPTLTLLGGIDRMFSNFPRQKSFAIDLFDASEQCKGTGHGYRFLFGANHTERWGSVLSKQYFGSYGAHIAYRTLTTKWNDKPSFDEYASGTDKMQVISPGVHLMWKGIFNEILLRTTVSGCYNMILNPSRKTRSETAGYHPHPFHIRNSFSFGLSMDIGYTMNY